MAEPFARRTHWINHDYKSRLSLFREVHNCEPSGTECWSMLIAAAKKYDDLFEAAYAKQPAALERIQ